MNHRTMSRRASIASLAILSLSVIVTTGAATASAAWTPPGVSANRYTAFSLVERDDVRQEANDLMPSTTGDLGFWEGTLWRNGKRYGWITGSKLTTDVNGVDESGIAGAVERQRTVLMNLPGGQIVALGATPYTASSGTIIEGHEFVIPIVGGSGKYFGARGEVHSVNRGNGVIEHMIFLAR